MSDRRFKMKIEIMNESHRDKVLELSKAFYCSDALDHEVPYEYY